MYNELVYLLDLCTLSYQLHSQTLIWPMDPYYERIGHRQWSQGRSGALALGFLFCLCYPNDEGYLCTIN